MSKVKNTCRYPKCNKTIPKNQNYCSQDCMIKHKEMFDGVNKNNGSKLPDIPKSGNIWLGQQRRKIAFKVMENLVKTFAPMDIEIFIAHATYQTGLSKRKVAEDYLAVLINTGIVKMEVNTILGIDEKRLEKLNGSEKE